MSLRSSRAENPWAIGITVFVAAKLLLLGGSQFFLGLAGVINDKVFAKVGGYVFRFDFWAIALIAIDVIVVWAVATTGQSAAVRS